MKEIEPLIAEHGTLRAAADEIRLQLGVQRGVGWDDEAGRGFDLARFLAAQRRFQELLTAHEAKEERMVASALRDGSGDESALESVLGKAHETLDGLTRLLHALSCVCDAKHLHAVRSACDRFRDELEAHLSYEEKALFPMLLRRAEAASKSAPRRKA